MKQIPTSFLIIVIGFLLCLTMGFEYQRKEFKLSFPYKKSGFTERQAAAHLLDRFTFGARPKDIDEVLRLGMEKWFLQQLDGGLAEDDLQIRLQPYDALKLSNEQVLAKYPRPVQVLKMAETDGYVKKGKVDVGDVKSLRKELGPYYAEKNLKPLQELYRQLGSQKILRAAYAKNQLHEILTDFWFNHFNVSISKNDCAQFVPAYERDVIRPNVTGKFQQILIATAKSPAMLLYLDNFNSAVSFEKEESGKGSLIRKRMEKRIQERLGDSLANTVISNLEKSRKSQGLNENYAREVMELHTLGVDGGYSQSDVTDAAKILTGWTIYPVRALGAKGELNKVFESFGEDRFSQMGFVRDGDFLFAANRHDRTEKKVLGKIFPAGGGYEEGVALLQMLAHHSSTAHFISKKLAIRFVQDDPPATLINAMATTFLATDGDIKQVLITMASSPEFWNKHAYRVKTKSPFELAVSAARSLNADIQNPYALYKWIEKMGQKLYYYQAPTGFPDKGQYWINTGSLLNRMNFGMALSSGDIRGVVVHLPNFQNNHEPESPEDALKQYCAIILPERNTSATIQQLIPLLSDSNLKMKIQQAASESLNKKPFSDEEADDSEEMKENKNKETKHANIQKMNETVQQLLEVQIAGIIIGSPEFQRR